MHVSPAFPLMHPRAQSVHASTIQKKGFVVPNDAEHLITLAEGAGQEVRA
jgi:hypothetical protein